jgi:hypothetical protein
MSTRPFLSIAMKQMTFADAEYAGKRKCCGQQNLDTGLGLSGH